MCVCVCVCVSSLIRNLTASKHQMSRDAGENFHQNLLFYFVSCILKTAQLLVVLSQNDFMGCFEVWKALLDRV